MPPPPLVDDSAGLAQWVEHLRACDRAAVDLEANGFHAYHEKICLIQVATEEHEGIIDPLAVEDLSPFGAWLADPAHEKVLHGSEFDVLSLKRDYGYEIRGLFDTMHAARLTGRKKLGLSALVEEIAGERLNKKFQRHDWGRRPLDPDAVAYARLDVRHLLRIQDVLTLAAKERGVTDQLSAAFRKVEAMVPKPRAFDQEGFKRLKGYEALDADGRRAARRVYLFRERVAERRNTAPFRVLSPIAIIDLGDRRPDSKRALKAMRGVPGWLVGRHGEALVKALDAARSDVDPGPPKRRRRRK